MQVSGAGYRVPIDSLKVLLRQNEEVQRLILLCVQQQALTMGQLAACNKFHEATPRLCRWLLMVADITGTEAFPLTHEFIGEMIGTGRPTVSITLGLLANAALIDSPARGVIRILSRERMEDAACDCYRVTKRILERLTQSLAIKP